MELTQQQTAVRSPSGPATTTAPPPRERRIRARHVVRVLSVLAVAGAWEIAGNVFPPILMPTLSATLAAFGRLVLDGSLLSATAASIQALAIGYLLALVVGVAWGLLMARYRTVDHSLDAYLTMMLVTPMVALIPFTIIVFGLSAAARVVVVFLFVLPSVAVNARAGGRSVSRHVTEMSRSFLLTGPQAFRWILLPAALPLIFAGLRIGFGLALSGMLLGELMITSVGLGGLLLDYSGRYLAAELFATILAILLVAIGGGTAIQYLDKTINRWLYRR